MHTSRRYRPAFAIVACLLLFGAVATAQIATGFTMSRSHPAIGYHTRPPQDAVARLQREITAGERRLSYDETFGYLRAVLDALSISPASQVLVFSKTSFQAPKINPRAPRALYFNDAVSVGWVQGGDYVEFAAQDPEQGTMFYTLRQTRTGTPTFERNASCLACHLSTSTAEVPGMFAGSIYPTPDGNTMYAPVYFNDHRSSFSQRWGGWYVTGRHGGARHMGNGVVTNPSDIAGLVADVNQNVMTLEGRVDVQRYLTPHSDIVALMALEHQMHLSNLLTRAAWEERIGSPEGRSLVAGRIEEPPSAGRDDEVLAATRPRASAVKEIPLRPVAEAAVEIVDYLLFVDETPFEGAIQGTSDFAREFASQGPRDSRGRSLRDLDLSRRLLRYPCSYMIYSAQFEALPAPVKDAVYARLWQVLSGGDANPVYGKLSLVDRQAIVEILRETKKDLPAFFQPIAN